MDTYIHKIYNVAIHYSGRKKTSRAYNPWLYNLIILICQNSILRIKDEKTGHINDFIIQH